MKAENRKVANETDCEVTVNDGSWMTCDMITEDEDAASKKEAAKETNGHGTAF